jgi:hypothetical protein
MKSSDWKKRPVPVGMLNKCVLVWLWNSVYIVWIAPSGALKFNNVNDQEGALKSYTHWMEVIKPPVEEDMVTITKTEYDRLVTLSRHENWAPYE